MPRSTPMIASIVAIAGLGLAVSALADRPPPPDARPLSEIVQSIESRPDFAYVEEIDWDDDGYWEIEYRMTDGAKVKIEIDAVSGQPRR